MTARVTTRGSQSDDAIRCIRDALGDKDGSRPSLLVGAGFSRNASPRSSNVPRFPTSEDLVAGLRGEIETYNRQHGGVHAQNSKCEPTLAKIAAEYESVFRRPRLDAFLRKAIPNADYEPGRLHERLLSLPWTDVFTTNYDTLLERTYTPERTYRVVEAEEELRATRPPRIVKLHGSFGNDTPLIITERDYRTYRDRFQLFVNTVRQALIENGLVLVGYSGDDPNFLEWVGWIQEWLHGSHPPIYMVSPSSTSASERSRLQSAGLTTIELADRAGKGRNTGHRDLLTVFVENLSKGQQRVASWQVDLMQTDPRATGRRYTADRSHSLSADDDGAEDRQRGIVGRLRQWRNERMAYPGWVIAPASRRQEVWHSTMHWIGPVLRASAKWALVDSIGLLSELNWRLEVAMVPLLPQWLDPLEAVIDAFERDLETDHSDGGPATGKDNTIQAQLSDWGRWGELVLATARAARETHDGARWTRHMQRVERLIVRCPGLTDRYQHEKALWRLAQIDRAGAREVVANWMPTESAPLGMLWKAGVVAEVGQMEEARELLRRALQAIRSAAHVDRWPKVERLSVEGWCTYLLLYVESSLDFDNYLKMRDDVWRRWRELSAEECNPLQIQEYLSTALGRKVPVRPPAVESRPTFDPGRRSLSSHLGGGGLGPWLPAFACLRWAERAGLPMRTGIMSGAAQNEWIRASKWVARVFPTRGISALVRMGAADVFQKDELIGRPRMARMEREDVESVNALVLGAVSREGAVLRDEPRPWLEVNVLNAVVEMSSRLTLKLDHDGLMKSFEAAMAMYVDWCGRDLHGLGNGLAHWFRRLYEAADSDLLARWLPAIVEAPLVPEQEEGWGRHWRDPLEGFPIRRIVAGSRRSGKTGRALRRAVERLLERGRSEVGRVRKVVVWRLAGLWRANLLNAAERRRAGALLWTDRAPEGLPYWRELEVEDYTTLPPRKGVDVPAVIKRQLLGDAERASSSAEGEQREGVLGGRRGAVLEVGPATQAVVAIPHEPLGAVTWEPDEVEQLRGAMNQWWSAARMTLAIERRLPAIGQSEGIRARAPLVEMFLVRVRVAGMAAAPEEEWEQLLEFVDDTRKYGVLLSAATPYFLIHRPDRRDATADRVTDDLAGGAGAVADYAARAVRHWVHLADAQLVEPVPNAVIGALVDRVAFRRLAGARFCVRELSALLVEKGAAFSGESVDRLISGLTAWEEAVAPEPDDHDGGGIAPDERPDLRERVGLLANALGTWWAEHRAGRDLPRAVREVLNRYRQDPLPEVRRAVSEGRWRYW